MEDDSSEDARQLHPFPHLPRGRDLVTALWLQRALENDRDGSVVVLEASWGLGDEYRLGHITGALHLDTDLVETAPPQWRLRTAPELQDVFGNMGIGVDSQVVVYGRTSLISAARIWWVLKYAGVTNVCVLDGGLSAWRAAGYSMDSEVRQRAPVSFSVPPLSHMVATTEHVEEVVASSCRAAWICDVRRQAEFNGLISGYSYLEARGRIPSALSLGDADDGAGIYCSLDGRLRSPEDVMEEWLLQGLVIEQSSGESGGHGRRFTQEVIFYCGGGWRSSLAVFHSWLLGLDNVRNYSDGWSGWSTNYEADEFAKGCTPGWTQRPTGRSSMVSTTPNIT